MQKGLLLRLSTNIAMFFSIQPEESANQYVNQIISTLEINLAMTFYQSRNIRISMSLKRDSLRKLFVLGNQNFIASMNKFDG